MKSTCGKYHLSTTRILCVLTLCSFRSAMIRFAGDNNMMDRKKKLVAELQRSRAARRERVASRRRARKAKQDTETHGRVRKRSAL